MIQRYATANVLAKLLGLRLDVPSDRETVLQSALPGFLKNATLLDALGAAAPGGTVLDSLQALSASTGQPVSVEHPFVRFAMAVLPAQQDLIAGTVMAYQEDPDALMKHLHQIAKPDVVYEAISQAINPDTLIRCSVCRIPFYTDGSRGCPHCES